MTRDLIALTLAFVLGGALLSTVVFPERLGFGTRALLSCALAVPATLLAALPGLATHELAAWNVLVGFAAIGLLAFHRWRRHRSGGLARRRLTAARQDSLERMTRQRFGQVGLVGLLLVATWFTVFVPENIDKVETGGPNGTIVYYHWGIVGRVVDAGGLPATLNEWGEPREFPYEYAFSVMHGASTAVLAGGADFRLEERYRIAMVASCFLAAFALWRRWLPAWWAWLAAVLTLSVSRIETRMLVYKPEAVAFVLVLWATWLLDEALERRSQRWGLLGAVVLACSFLAHPVGSLLAGPLWGGVLLGRLVTPLLTERLSGLRSTVARGGRQLTRIGRVVVPAMVVFIALFAGTRLVVGATGQDLQQHPIGGVDETRVVYNLAYISSDPFAHPPVPEASDLFGVYSTVRPFFSQNARWFYFDVNSRSSVLLLIGLVAILAAVIAISLGSRLAEWAEPILRGLITWLGYAAGVCLLALLIGAVYHTWVPERVAPMRLMPYWGLVFPGFLAGLAWAGAVLLSHAIRSVGVQLAGKSALRSSWFVQLSLVVPVVLLSSATLWSFTSQLGGRDPGIPPFFTAETRVGGVSPEALAAYGWIKERLPTNAVILANGYTEGALGMVSDRTGLLDGRTPFSQPDPWRSDAIRWLERSRAFFQEPDEHRIPPRAGYLLVAPANINLGGSYFPTNFPQLNHSHRLKLIHRFGKVLLFRVREWQGIASPKAPA